MCGRQIGRHASGYSLYENENWFEVYHGLDTFEPIVQVVNQHGETVHFSMRVIDHNTVQVSPHRREGGLESYRVVTIG